MSCIDDIENLVHDNHEAFVDIPVRGAWTKEVTGLDENLRVKVVDVGLLTVATDVGEDDRPLYVATENGRDVLFEDREEEELLLPCGHRGMQWTFAAEGMLVQCMECGGRFEEDEIDGYGVTP